MAYTPTNPPTVPAYVPSPHAVDTYFLPVFRVGTVPNDPAAVTLEVQWLEGFTDDGGKFVIAPQNDEVLGGGGVKTKHYSGPALLAAMSGPVDPNKTIYENVRDATWAFMAAQGDIPPGTVT